MTDKIYDVDQLLTEIYSNQFSLEYTSILAHYFIKASQDQRREINKVIQDTPLKEAVTEYISAPKIIKTSLNSLVNLPDFYELSLSEETQNLMDSKDGYEININLELINGSICSYQEISEPNSVFEHISGLWASSKKQIAAGFVVASILAPPAIWGTKLNFWNTPEEFSFQSNKKNYSKIFNEGIIELAKLNHPKIKSTLSQLSDKEMKFFIKNLEKQEVFSSFEDKKIVEIQAAIEHYYPYKIKDSFNIAQSIKNHSEKYNLDPVLFLSIMKVESDFNQEAYNPSGDYSIVQINYNIWSKEFKNQGKLPLDKEKLKNDSDYAIERMAEILSILHERHSKTDPIWYARYHNWKKSKKIPYAKKINKEIDTLSDLQMDVIAEKLLQIKNLAIQLNQETNSTDNQKIENLVASLEEIHFEYSSSKQLVAVNDE